MGSGTSQEPSEKKFSSQSIGGESKKLFLRFIGILVVAPLVGDMMARAWVLGNLFYDQAVKFLPEIIGVTPTHAMQLISCAGLGLYFGLLTVFILDIKKRVQGALLLIGTAIGLAILTQQGVLLPNLNPAYQPNFMAFGVAYAAALALDIDELLSISLSESSFGDPRTKSGDIPEFNNAANALFAILSLIIVASLAQVIIADTYTILDFIGAALTIYLLHSFIQYEVKSNYTLLGPGQSGKSMAMLGMALAMYDYEDINPKPNTYLQGAIERASDPHYADEWPFEQTEGLQETSFQVLVGDLFPKRMRIVAFDYPGQLLSEIPNKLKEITGTSTFSTSSSQSNPSPAKADGGTATKEGSAYTVAKDVANADILMVVIDFERLIGTPAEDDTGSTVENQSLGIEYYNEILDAVDVENVIIAATKADVLAHDDSFDVDLPETDKEFTRFKQEVDSILDQRYDIQELKQQLEQPDIHPVFYRTQEVNGELIPERDSANNLIPVGYKQLVDAIRREN